jgi:AcrR family transcriptional regulator
VGDLPPLRGRQAEALRNDQRILDAALDVFAEEPQAPMNAVADRAGVGQASLYRRYPSKDALLGRVCERGMTRIRDVARAALAGAEEPREALYEFLRWYLDSGTPRLAGLLGSFTPAAHLFTLARDANEALQALVDRAAAAGTIRSDVTAADLTLLVTQISALERPDPARAAALRHRYLELVLQALSLRDAPELPSAAPDAAELERPWAEVRLPDGP